MHSVDNEICNHLNRNINTQTKFIVNSVNINNNCVTKFLTFESNYNSIDNNILFKNIILCENKIIFNYSIVSPLYDGIYLLSNHIPHLPLNATVGTQ